ncbi:hypothetical protein HMPREF9120_02217 [Neisseria sp. oral taxon 020 str. F0370]|nr:hypothetical protein HMPREF9120_02217 [Neisseria sp. oral taxon 020 str. F0370]
MCRFAPSPALTRGRVGEGVAFRRNAFTAAVPAKVAAAAQVPTLALPRAGGGGNQGAAAKGQTA